MKLQSRESEEPRCETRAQQQHARRRYRPQLGRRKQRKQGGYDATEASRIQKLYRRSRVRAIKAITEEDSPYCAVPLNDVHTHFSKIYKDRELNDAAMPPEVPELHGTTQGDEDPFVDNFTPGEVWARLYRCGNTSPGPDGIRYSQWKKTDRGGHVLSSVYNAVQRMQHVPTPWKKSSTILIHKKGERLNLANWRPIALSDTIAKLYASVLAERLGQWATRNNRISNAQKGFRPVDGCSEHNFALQAVITDARRSRRQCCVAWLDLTNAFESIPHSCLFRTLRWAGLTEKAIEVIEHLYKDNTTSVRCGNEYTPDIPIRAGVKQGCPLSPIIFNLALEPMLRAVVQQEKSYTLHGATINVLAYADDLALTSETPEGLQTMLDVACRVATWTGLSFNPSKCATLHIDGKNRDTIHTEFPLQQGTPEPLSDLDVYEHLGVPTGYHVAASAERALVGMHEKLGKIGDSLLAPCQKLDAINTFVVPCISFHLRNGVVQKGRLDILDKRIKSIGKKCLNLPQRASVEPLYISYQMGGLNLLPLNLLADVSQLAHGLSLLRSPDLGPLAHALLTNVVQKRIRRPPELPEVAEYLSGSMEGDFAHESTDITNTWTRLRTATRRLKAKINVSWQIVNEELTLCLNDFILHSRTAEHALRNAIRGYFRDRLRKKPDQGKVSQITGAASASNHFMRNGDFTRFPDWRFIHRARLDCVLLNGTRRFGQGDKRCRRCGHARETLPHVLCHCKPNLAAATRRHNAILDRLVKAFRAPPTTCVRINQTVPGFPGALRPDFLALDETAKAITLVDVTMPFENGSSAFQSARSEKIRKYGPLADHFRQQGYDVFSDAFVVGALGGWDPGNERIITHMRLGQRYCHLMRRLMVSDAIRWSRDIYVGHVTGVRQYLDDTATRA
jgi:hypothetical protein